MRHISVIVDKANTHARNVWKRTPKKSTNFGTEQVMGMGKKPHKKTGREAKQRRQEAAKDRQERGRELLKKTFGAAEEAKG